MLQEYSGGVETPDENGPFPEQGFAPNLDGSQDPYVMNCKYVDLYTVKGKVVGYSAKDHVIISEARPVDHLRVRSRQIGIWDMFLVLSGEARLSDVADGDHWFPCGPPWKISHSSCLVTILYAFPSTSDKTDGHLSRPDAVQRYPHFSLEKDRLYKVSSDIQRREEISQLLVPKSQKWFSMQLIITQWLGTWGMIKH